MPVILPRYILRRVLSQVLGVAAVLFLIVVVLQFTRVLARAAESRFPSDLLLDIIFWGAVQNIAIILPVALLMGIVLALGRLYEEREMAAMAACGAAGLRVTLPVLLVVLATAAVLAWLTLVYNPRAAAELESQKTRALQLGFYANLQPGEFRSFESGRLVLHAEQVAEDGALKGVFAQRQLPGEREVVIVARRGHIERSADRMPVAIVLDDGTYYALGTRTLRQRMMGFTELRVPVERPSVSLALPGTDTLSTRVLLHSSRPQEIAEWHMRLALPIMALVLGVVAIPLSRLRPGQGRYGRAAVAILIYFLYANSLTAGETWIANGSTPAWAGLWWVHALAVIIAFGVYVVSRRARRGGSNKGARLPA